MRSTMKATGAAAGAFRSEQRHDDVEVNIPNRQGPVKIQHDRFAAKRDLLDLRQQSRSDRGIPGRGQPQHPGPIDK